MNFCSLILLMFISPYIYIRFHEDMHPIIFWTEHSRKVKEMVKQEKEQGKLGPMYDGCNLCVWRYCTPSLKTPSDSQFSPTKDVSLIKDAISTTFRHDYNKLLDVLAARTEMQRLAVLGEYQKTSSAPLVKSFESSSFTSDLRLLLYVLALPIEDFYAMQFRKGFHELKRDKVPETERKLVRIGLLEMFSSLPSCLLKKIYTSYQVMYKEDFMINLQTVLKDQPQTDSIDVYLALASTMRDDSVKTDWYLAWSDAKKLSKAVRIQDYQGRKKFFREIYTKRSILQIRETVILYEKLRKNDPRFVSIYEDIRLGFESAQDIYSTITKVATQKSAYFVDGLNSFIKTKDLKSESFFAFLRGHCGINLGDIVKEFFNIEQKTIEAAYRSAVTSFGEVDNAVKKIMFSD